MDKELEIKRQFLDEAQDYLDDLDHALMGIADDRIDPQKINAALRAAHSIKGGGGMMGFTTLSDLAHRLEDTLKVLKIQKAELHLDGALENLLLRAVSQVRQVITWEWQSLQQGHPGSKTDPWLTTQVLPIFEELHDRLGEPESEDAQSMLSPEEGQDIVPLLFETEVEGCLQRLETVLATPEQPCLREELTILAQELGGLGEMLQLNSFIQLCTGIGQLAEAASEDQVGEVAQAALRAWRTTQQQVLAGQWSQLPTQLDLESADLQETQTQFPAEFADEFSMSWEEALAVAQSELTTDDIPIIEDGVVDDFAIPAAIADSILDPVFAIPTPAPIPASTSVTAQTSRTTDNRKSFEIPANLQTAFPEEGDEDATVRVSVRQLNQLNDLFSELAIARNGLDLYLKRLRSLMRNLNDRVKQLDGTNTQARSLYDRTTRQSDTRLGAFLLPPASDRTQPGGNEGSSSSQANLPAGFKFDSGAVSSHEITGSFDNLEMDRYSDVHLISQQVMETIVQIQEVTSDLDLSLDDAEQSTRDLTKASKQLQTKLTQLRMRPLSDITDRFPRALRELSLEYGKKVRLNVLGGNTLIDRNILETLQDPMMHLLRNAFDHGLERSEQRLAQGKSEEGVIEITAQHRGNRTIITLRDDGNGIPLEKIRQRAMQMGLDAGLLASASETDLLSLIFEPGFSTSESVTALSGRGVGMDVVRDNLNQIRGEISVNTTPGQGTIFTLTIPYTLSIVRILLAESNGMLLAMPQDTVGELLMLQPHHIQWVEGQERFVLGNEAFPLLRLGKYFQFSCVRQPQTLDSLPTINAAAVLMTQVGQQRVALQIDRCWGEQEVAIRRVEDPLRLPAGLSSCALLGDGRIVPLLNVPDLMQWVHAEPTLVNLPNFAPPSSLFSILPPTPQRPTVLVVDDSINVRRFLALTLERAGYRVEQAKDGQDALEKLQAGLPVNAAICDIEMPKLDGFGLLAKMKADSALRSLPIAMLTSRSGDKHRRLALSLGANAYFSKPYNEQELLRTLEQMVTPATTV
ncbi:MAG: hybrid sensor histidine kinase/response regulator [Synechococcales bacterium]|nr:hybrid sensor histidine kinase/response regulator [Synechococcales bacterium]